MTPDAWRPADGVPKLTESGVDGTRRHSNGFDAAEGHANNKSAWLP